MFEPIVTSISPPNLEEIIKNRKNEVKLKVKENQKKRLRKLEEGSNDGWNPLEILPRELWEIILRDKLIGLKSVESARNTCSLFHDILATRHFREVLFPVAFQAIPIQDLLKLRLVCKLWRDCVDQRLENEFACFESDLSRDSSFLIRNCDDLTPPTTSSTTLAISPTEMNRLECALAHFSTPCGGPNAQKLLGRSITLSLDHVQWDNTHQNKNIHEFITQMDLFLKLIGDQLLHFKLIVGCRLPGGHEHEHYSLSLPEIYSMILAFLERMPNLRWLTIKQRSIMEHDHPPVENDDLRSIIATNPVPVLKHLKKIEISLLNCTSFKLLLEAILSSNKRHLSHLTLKQTSMTMNNFPSSHKLPEVVRALNLDSINFIAPWTFSFQKLDHFINFNWKLKTIHLEFPCHCRWVQVGDLFGFLEKFPTLQKITLKIFHLKGNTQQLLQLPNVTHFSMTLKQVMGCHMDNIRIPKCIDFLIPMKNLQHFSWHTEISDVLEEADEHEIIQFNGGRVNLYNSNIWNVFPSLAHAQVILELVSIDYRYPQPFRIRTYKRCFRDVLSNSNQMNLDQLTF